MGKIIIPRGGDKPIRGIYDPKMMPIVETLGECELARASHVEPTASLSESTKDWLACFARLGNSEHYKGQPELPKNKWWADMQPVGGPVLGPFDTRDEALEKEVEWLQKNKIPVASDPLNDPIQAAGGVPTELIYVPVDGGSDTLAVKKDSPLGEMITKSNGACSIQIEPPTEPVMTQADLSELDESA